ncbi:hypothetical protein [Aliarcobacter cryaerophilus]|uniref:hypothetical protein n=1 Tax=Aliarcobacter cryaerophilus TaxID=28198 RepID=UPI000826CEC9|nr:hypothetical protein [Aliarcobacter cryaerophilus]
MKIDVDYLKTILDKFVESEIQYIETSIFNELLEDEIFLFHWDILLDKGLIVNSKGELGKFYEITQDNCKNYWDIKVRLNNDGYKFYQALKDEEFRSKIKNGLTDVGMDTLISLGKKYIDKKVDMLF